MPNAIVTGATGILGRTIVQELIKDSSTWKTVHALSRSQKEPYPENVQHDTIDLTGNVQQMTNQLQGVEGEYIFFAAYLQGKNEQENWDLNGNMLENFLTALQTTGALAKVKRIILVTGAKQYGVHLGRPRNPMIESDPRIDGDDRPPNFYYRQQDILIKFASQSGGAFDWVVTYPNDVIGIASNNFMNLATPLAIYALVCRELGGNMPWPGSQVFYHCGTTFTDSTLHAQFCVWASQQPQCSNQAYNVVNGDVECWEHMWPALANYFGAHVPADQFAQQSANEIDMALEKVPPLAAYANSAGLKGSEAIQQTKIQGRIDLDKWSRQGDVRAAWNALAKREHLDVEALEKAPWWFLQFVLGRPFNILISASKAREAGWTGYLDTWKSFENVFKGLEEIKVVPKRK